MEFSLSWLADYVDLHLGAALRSDAGQRHSFEDVTEEERRRASQIGERLTSVGLAVESIAERAAAAGAVRISCSTSR